MLPLLSLSLTMRASIDVEEGFVLAVLLVSRFTLTYHRKYDYTVPSILRVTLYWIQVFPRSCFRSAFFCLPFSRSAFSILGTLGRGGGEEGEENVIFRVFLGGKSGVRPEQQQKKMGTGITDEKRDKVTKWTNGGPVYQRTCMHFWWWLAPVTYFICPFPYCQPVFIKLFFVDKIAVVSTNFGTIFS